MFNITLISSRHENLGKCNSNELFHILERINPEVIFEEKPPSRFDQYYIEGSRFGLESDAIKKYNNKYDIEQILVDSEYIPSGEFFNNFKQLIKKVEGLSDVNGFNFRSLHDKNELNMELYGFKYLNSGDCVKIYNEIRKSIVNGLQKLNDEKLFQVYKEWNDVIEMRDLHMLQNIYNYSKNNSYERAVFIIGVAHRNSMIEKISDFQKKEPLSLNWII